MFTPQQALQRLLSNNELFHDEMTDLMRQIMRGEVAPELIAAILIGLRIKVETVSEISAAAQVMREFAAKVPVSEPDKLVDVVGTGGDGARTFNISTCAMFVAAAAGAFLAGNINDKIGLLDDFGMTTRRTRNTQTGELNPAEQVITFGKRITNELYLGYEYSVTSANQAVKLIWQINSALQVISRVGTDSVSGEVRYTVRFD